MELSRVEAPIQMSLQYGCTSSSVCVFFAFQRFFCHYVPLFLQWMCFFPRSSILLLLCLREFFSTVAFRLFMHFTIFVIRFGFVVAVELFGDNNF